MKIKISGIQENIHYYDFSVGPDTIGLGSEYTSPVELSVKITKSNKQFYVECKARTEKKAVCDRCLVNFNLKLNIEYKIIYSYETKEQFGDFDDIQYLKPDDDFIDLSDDIRQMLILSIPMKQLCNENCKGLCPSCGQDLNIKQCECNIDRTNPKFEELKKLKFE